MASDIILKLQSIQVQYDDTPVLQGIDLNVARGDRIWIHGPSGGGKTTLLKVLFCAEFFSGSLLYQNRPVEPACLEVYRSRLGFVSQKIPDFDCDVDEVLQYPFHFRANRRLPFPHARAMELLSELRFDRDILARRFSDLSGGEKQRLMVLLMLLINRPIFLLDEVTAALDPDNIETVIRLLTASAERTIISVSHDTVWKNYCSRSLSMQAGRLREAR